MDDVDARTAVAERLASWLSTLTPMDVPAAAMQASRSLLLDVLGLSIAARNESYVKAAIAATDPGGACSVFGHAGAFNGFDAALVNGTAAHGEDFDDTFEGCPVHSGAVIVSALIAACERQRLGGDRLLVGIASGAEVMCRLGLVEPKAIHAAGFHPTAVIGALAAAAAVSTSLGLDARRTTSAIGVAGSMASGIIEYLAEGTWTKRMHAGWAAQAGLRAALMAEAGFLGPRTVLEGVHGFFNGFAHSRRSNFSPLLDGLGERWIMEAIAFKPYACGTMTQPFVDCAIALAERGVDPDQIVDVVCEVGEGTVHRLWETLAVKQEPPTPYAAKFSTPFCMAVAFFDRAAGFRQFTEPRIHDPRVLQLSRKIRYVINERDEYPRNFTGHLRATMRNGETHEIRQGFMRGGARAPLTQAELERKFRDNAIYGGWTEDQAKQALDWTRRAFEPDGLTKIQLFRR